MHVIKLGGASGIANDAFAEDVAAWWQRGEALVLVHGGSDETNRLAEQLGHPPRFVTSPSGHVSRVTDERTLEIFIMATALVNRRLVSRLRAAGVDAIGLSGLDGGLIRGRRKDAIRVVEDGRQRILRDDWTGRPEAVRGDLLTDLLDRGCLPVIAPVAAGRQGEPLNVDGDRAAAALAGALGARSLVILSNVPGLLRSFPDESSLVERAAATEIGELGRLASGRMLKKLLAAQEALHAGVPEVVIGDARRAQPLTDSLAGMGTVICATATARAVEAS